MTDLEKLNRLHALVRRISLGDKIRNHEGILHDGQSMLFKNMTLAVLSELIKFYIDREVRRRMEEPPKPFCVDGQWYEYVGPKKP